MIAQNNYTREENHEYENQMLVLRENAKQSLMQIKTIDEGKTYLNKLKSIETWVKAEKKDAELQNMIAEQKLRTQRILGMLLKDTELDKGGGDTSTGARIEPVQSNAKLEDLGITKKQSSVFQKIASIPEPKFEEFIQEKKEAVNKAVAELTTTGALKLASMCNPCESDAMKHRVVTYLNITQYEKFEALRRGEKEAEYLREIIIKHNSNPQTWKDYDGKVKTLCNPSKAVIIRMIKGAGLSSLTPEQLDEAKNITIEEWQNPPTEE